MTIQKKTKNVRYSVYITTGIYWLP